MNRWTTLAFGVLDVRRPDEIGRIGGFEVYLTVQPADVEKSLALIPRDRTIFTVSNHALGVEDYEAAGGSLIRIAPRTPAAASAQR